MFVFTSWLVSHGVCIHIQYFFGVVRNKLQTLNIYRRFRKNNVLYTERLFLFSIKMVPAHNALFYFFLAFWHPGNFEFACYSEGAGGRGESHLLIAQNLWEYALFIYTTRMVCLSKKALFGIAGIVMINLIKVQDNGEPSSTFVLLSRLFVSNISPSSS